MSERDHQRVEEVERQRGYGEGFRKGEDVEDQSTVGAGYKEGSPIADQPDPNAAIRIVHDFRHERQARHSVLAKLTQINGMAAFDLQRIERDLDQGAVVAAPDSTFVFEKCYSFQGGRSLKTIATQHPGSLVSGKADLIARVDTHQRWQVGKLGPFVIIGFPPEKIPLPTPQMAPSGASTRFDTKA
ncbi:hypothetical protein [Henriciella sp.]|uniref:hypothetical protein n=1 Tax=Henriciella sp. TaxID=1968823 RepID=UPI0017F26832|nr:hypothetical protein [Henriciella sp.]HIG21216.1 hypothetical protein [Henriciella sp.]